MLPACCGTVASGLGCTCAASCNKASSASYGGLRVAHATRVHSMMMERALPDITQRSPCGGNWWERTLFTTCPLKGKRAPEAACGSILAKLREAYQVADVEVAAFCCHLDRGHHDEIMNDWNAGRRFVESLLTTKVAYWSSLPWHLCGIGHHDLAEARLCAKRCLVAYTARPNTEEHHRFTNQLLGVASPLRSDLEKFANGSPLCALSSDFQRKRCELKFVPIAERIIEGNTLWSSEPSPARTKSAAQSQFH